MLNNFNGRAVVDRIKGLCKENNIKISEIEEKMDLSKGYFSRWVNSCPSAIEVLYNLSNEFSVSADYILGLTTGEKSSKGDNSTINTIVENTEDGIIAWSRVDYNKAKKTRVISVVNAIVYDNNIHAYETTFNEYHLMFVYKKNDYAYELYIENNNEYIMLSSDNRILHTLYNAIAKSNNRIVNTFFST